MIPGHEDEAHPHDTTGAVAAHQGITGEGESERTSLGTLTEMNMGVLTTILIPTPLDYTRLTKVLILDLKKA